MPFSSNSITHNARKSADQSVTASTVLVDETDLQITLEAGKNYKFDFFIRVNVVNVATGVKISVVAPATPTDFSADAFTFNPAGSPNIYFDSTTTAPLAISRDTANDGQWYCHIRGHIENAISGTLKLQFAQKTSDAAAITLQRGSTLEVKEIL